MKQKSNKELLDEAIFLYPGWAELIKNLDRLIKSVDPDYEILQIKEKFGGLRYYIGTSEKYNKKEFIPRSDPISIFVSVTGQRSFATCENCGKVDVEKIDVETRPNEGEFWIRTLCKKCREE